MGRRRGAKKPEHFSVAQNPGLPLRLKLLNINSRSAAQPSPAALREKFQQRVIGSESKFESEPKLKAD